MWGPKYWHQIHRSEWLITAVTGLTVASGGYLWANIPADSSFWSAIPFLHPVDAARALTLFGLAVFGALRLSRIRSNLLAGAIALLVAIVYFTSPVQTPYYNTRTPRLILLALLATAPIIAALRSVREGELREYAAKTYFPTLDGWRTIAVGLVIADHLTNYAVPGRIFRYIFNWRGQHGVNLFFGISGFLITSKLLAEYRDTDTISLTAFYRRRALRILPAAFLYLLVLWALFPSVSTYEFTSCVLFFRNLTQGVRLSGVTSHYWSLSIEEQFYLCLPALLLLLTPRRFRFVAAVMAILCAGWRILCLQADFCPVDDLFITFRTDIRIDGLLCGSLLAFAFQDEVLRNKLSRITTPRLWLVAFVLYLAVFFQYPVFTTLAESVLVVVLIGGTVLHPSDLPGRILESSPLRYIGRMSYGIYLWQHLFCFPTNIPGGAPQILRMVPFNLVATFVAAAFSFYLLEKPILSLGRRKPKISVAVELSPVENRPEPVPYEEPAVLV